MAILPILLQPLKSLLFHCAVKISKLTEAIFRLALFASNVSTCFVYPKIGEIKLNWNSISLSFSVILFVNILSVLEKSFGFFVSRGMQLII